MKKTMTSLLDNIKRTTMANVVAAILVVAGMIYAIYTNNTDLVTFLAGAGVGYLFKRWTEQR
ncbi:MAG: hypothetical protein DRO12_02480 [Thermoprotei archaeon]|nr:MAG: hypothetical protein DRO12_02480 [Thermoprotei archaeon]